MKTFLNIIGFVGLIFFGVFWFKSFYHVVTFNSIIPIFKYESTESTIVKYKKHTDSEKVNIHYNFKVGDTTYSKQITANVKAFEEKVGLSQSLHINYNKLIPSVNYIKNWKLEAYYNFTFILFSFFFGLMIFFQLGVNKQYWINKYSKALSNNQ